MTSEPPREIVREREVVERPGGGGPWGVVAAIIGAIVLVLLIWFLFVGMDPEMETPDADPGVEAPDEIDVDVDVPDAEAPDADADGGS